ncbi:MAG: ABC transporter ATP-binding protein/permease [Pseudomonadota bacterium]
MRVVERVKAEHVVAEHSHETATLKFDQSGKTPEEFFASRRPSGAELPFLDDLIAIYRWVSDGLMRPVSGCIVLPAGLMALFWLDPRLGMAVTMPIFWGFGLMVFTAARIRLSHCRARANRWRLADELIEPVLRAPDHALTRQTGIRPDQLTHGNERLVGAAFERARMANFLQVVPDIVAGLSVAAILAVAVQAELPMPVVAGAFAALALMAAPMRDLAAIFASYPSWQNAQAKAGPQFREPRLETPTGREPNAQDPTLVFEEVPTGDGGTLTLSVTAGQKIAVLGEASSGKSRLLAYAAGLEVPSEGSVTFGKIPSSAIDPRYRAREIAWIGPELAIPGASLRRILSSGARRTPPDLHLIEIAQTLGLRPLLDRLGGLDGHVAQGGKNLLHGEAMLIQFASVLVTRPKLILLDCPDRALDGRSMERVFAVLRATRATVLVATESPSVAMRLPQCLELSSRLASSSQQYAN